MLMTGWMIVRYEPVTAPQDADVVVYVSPRCTCYRPWIRDLRRDGLAVGVVQTADIAKSQAELGVPREFVACHTAVANDHWIEGHVRAASIISLLKDSPADVVGVAYLRAEIQSGDQLAWEVVSYNAEGDPITSRWKVESPLENDTGATDEQWYPMRASAEFYGIGGLVTSAEGTYFRRMRTIVDPTMTSGRRL